jgi:hypothetical protein
VETENVWKEIKKYVKFLTGNGIRNTHFKSQSFDTKKRIMGNVFMHFLVDLGWVRKLGRDFFGF